MKTLKDTPFSDITETEWTSVLLACEYIESWPEECDRLLSVTASMNKIEKGELVHGLSIVSNRIIELLNS